MTKILIINSMEERLTLHISTIDANLTDQTIFYIHPKRMPIIHILKSHLFESCLIDYTPIDLLTSINFAYIMKTLKSEATCTVVIHQPISVMQEFDAKQIEANAKLAGFINFENSVGTFKDAKSGKEFNTISVNCSKPVRKVVEVEVKVNKTTKPKSNRSPRDKKNEDVNVKVEVEVNKNKNKK